MTQTTLPNSSPSSTRKCFAFNRDRLPSAFDYYTGQGMNLTGGGEWKNAICPFHQDSTPSLRLRLDSGGFRCMVCGAHGGDVLAFHMRKHGLSFVEACKELRAWELMP